MRLEALNRTLFHPGQRICCALSGGADSTALLLALLDANAERASLGVVLSAIHVHHGLRGADADADEAFVRELCQRHGVRLSIRHVDTAARQQSHREGLEEAARELRYAAFRELLAQDLADGIATAHTLDDQAETVLMKLLRGAWTEGLGGISPVLRLTETGRAPVPSAPSAHVGHPRSFANPVILRPMLDISRAAVEAFLRARNQTWQVDASNADTGLTRNRVRHELMPLLRSFNPSVDETLSRTSALAREDDAFWQAETDHVLPGLLLPGKPVRGGGRAVSTTVGARSVAIELERLRVQPPALRGRLLRAAAATLGCRPDAADTLKLLALAGVPAPGCAPVAARNGARLELGNGLRAERSLRELRLSRIDPAAIPRKV